MPCPWGGFYASWRGDRGCVWAQRFVSPSKRRVRSGEVMEDGDWGDCRAACSQCKARRELYVKRLLTLALLLWLLLSLWPVCVFCVSGAWHQGDLFSPSPVGVLTPEKSDERLISPVAALCHVNHKSKEFLPFWTFIRFIRFGDPNPHKEQPGCGILCLYMFLFTTWQVLLWNIKELQFWSFPITICDLCPMVTSALSPDLPQLIHLYNT